VTASLNTPMRPLVRTIDGLSIRYAESAPRDEQALLLSHWPESLYAFAPTWASLAEHAHLVAVDLPGFGHSARRDKARRVPARPAPGELPTQRPSPSNSPHDSPERDNHQGVSPVRGRSEGVSVRPATTLREE
jgi:pimeloyl-ACP methyl ester carboxylesterase